MKSGPTDNSALTAAMLRYVHARTAALIEARRELRINELDARALLFIADNPGTRPGTLSSFLGITSAGVTTLIDRLIQRGAVRREVDPGDRRVNRITVTVDFSAAPWSALTRFDDAFDHAVVAGEGSDIRSLASALNRFTDAAAAASP
ncbi:MarR family winged helix-turn-helix transcriptional regulator [Microbacterium sp. SS28]|uniref:MarR family winged helix-turn-helix transcriptional regulator n=1 Tax=Microbacterium sp. SS28 TaxID=2919948 RepID=UPI001FAB026E|nr:MarR family transcriptional regulator [Microbacterium sp. SS28]